MWVRHTLQIILLIFTNLHMVLCFGKGSLTYVIDTTPSMTAEINQVKQSTNSITKVVFDEKSSQIQNMVLVTFSDPNADLKIVTANRYTFKRHIDKVFIKWPNVYDCPEMSMAGTLLALDNSLPGSYIYVFTDASAKDYSKSSQVIKKCQEKQSQIVFILTGDCGDYDTHPYQIYYDIAAACSGLTFYVGKDDVLSIFEPIKDAIKGKKELITSRTIPADVTKDIPFEISDQTEYASVTASGKGVTLQVRGTSYSGFRTERLTWLNNVKMLRLSQLLPGTYIATVRSSSITTINIFSRTDFSFEYGFSGLDADSLKDTLPQPIADTTTHIFVSVTDPNHTTNITSAIILDMNENVMPNYKLPLRRTRDNYYVTPPFLVPSTNFKIAVLGISANTGKEIRRLARFPITPQLAAKVSIPQISGKPLETVKMGGSVDIKCMTTNKGPAPKISWQFMAEGKSKFQSITGSNNVLHISSVRKEDAGRYKCIASNVAGISEHDTTLIVEFKPSIPTDNSKIYEGLEGDNKLRIPCNAAGIPKVEISWSVNGTKITKGPRYSITDGALIITNPKTTDTNIYKCEAKNYLGSAYADFNVQIKGVPKINSNDTTTYEGSDGDAELRIPCEAFGVPPPTISWSINRKTIRSGPHYSINGGVLVIKNAKMIDSGTYRCEATNSMGSTHADFNVKIKGIPYINSNDTKTLEGLEGDSALRIPCNAVGVPPPTITWSNNGKTIRTDPHYAISSDGTLIIKNPKMIDSGSYTCKATNSLGSGTSDFKVVIKGVPYIYPNNSKIFEGLEGDVALRIPCEAMGIPTPKISWYLNGKPINTGAHYTILDGVLIIKDPKMIDSGSYKCKATNNLGSTSVVLNVTVGSHLDDYGSTEEIKINKKKHSWYRLECGMPSQSVRWFMEGNDLNIRGNYLTLYDLDAAYNGNYTCRVSDIQETYTKTFHLVIDGPPKFEFDQQDPVFDWTGNDDDQLNCNIESTNNVKVDWTYNGEVLSDHKSLMLSVGGKWGKYTCNVSNDFGSIQRTFEVISSRCLVSKVQKHIGAMPIIINERYIWPTNSIKNYITFEQNEKIALYCPNYKRERNNFKKFPRENEITAICDKQDIFILNGKPNKISDLECDHYLTPTVQFENKRCGKGPTKSIIVGYNGVPSFLETYEVCFDTSKNMPQYSLVVMPSNYQSRDVHYNWYKHPAVEFPISNSLYTCKDSTSTCCYGKSQLVAARDFSDGPAQNTTFIESINAIPLWRPCRKTETTWQDVEENIRLQLDLLPASIIWSGTHIFQKKNGHLVPRYLFKLVEFIEGSPIAVVYINGPSPTKADVLCKNICADGEVIWLNDLGDHIYCCNGDEFREAFHFNAHKNVNI